MWALIETEALENWNDSAAAMEARVARADGAEIHNSWQVEAFRVDVDLPIHFSSSLLGSKCDESVDAACQL